MIGHVSAVAAGLATTLSWVWALTHPVERGSHFDFSPLERLFYCGAAMIVTLAVWLAFFAASAAGWFAP